MPNTIVTPITVAKAAMAILENNLVFGSLVYRDADANFAGKVGDTVNIRKPATIAPRELTTTVTQDNITEEAVPVKVDKHMYIQIPVTAKEKAMSLVDFSGQILMPALTGHAQAIDAALAGLYVDVPYSTAMTSTKVIDDIIAVSKELSLQKCPPSERRLVLDPTSKAGYVGLAAFVNAEKKGSTDAIREASLGRVFGLDTYEDQNIVTHTKGTYATANASGTAGASTIAVSSLNGATVTIKKGDIFTIANDTQRYVATENGTGSSSAIASLGVWPALKTSPSNAAMTLVDTSGYNAIGFHKNAFALVMRSLEPSEGGAVSSVATYNGFSLRVTKAWDNTILSDVYTIDCLWGIKTLDPQLAVRLIS